MPALFSNLAGITIPASGTGPGTSDPVYSYINVSGLPSTINFIQVDLANLSHTFPADLDVYFGSASTGYIQLMSDAGSSFDLTNANLAFVPDSFSTAALPQFSQIISSNATSPITYYRGTNYGSGDIPGNTYPTDLATFIGSNPNNSWGLYIYDDAAGDSGYLGGWFLHIGTAPYNVSAGGTYNITDQNGVTLNASATDGDGQALSYSWDLNGDGIFGDVTGQSPFVSRSTLRSYGINLGTYAIRVRASDGYGPTTSAFSYIVVTDDDTTAPTITLTGSSGTQTTTQNQQFNWQIQDVSGSSSTVTVRRDGVLIFSRNYTSNVSSDSFDFNSYGLGSYVISINATDHDSDRPGDASSSSLSRTVNVVNTPPVSVPLPDVNVSEDAPDTVINLSSYFVDPRSEE
ncbi:MAG: hypothetical protein AB7K24_22745, partial [Gemmataceae bacterium]